MMRYSFGDGLAQRCDPDVAVCVALVQAYQAQQHFGATVVPWWLYFIMDVVETVRFYTVDEKQISYRQLPG